MDHRFRFFERFKNHAQKRSRPVSSRGCGHRVPGTQRHRLGRPARALCRSRSATVGRSAWPPCRPVMRASHSTVALLLYCCHAGRCPGRHATLMRTRPIPLSRVVARLLPLPLRPSLLPHVMTLLLPSCRSCTRAASRCLPLAQWGAVRMWPCMPPSFCHLRQCCRAGHADRACTPIVLCRRVGLPVPPLASRLGAQLCHSSPPTFPLPFSPATAPRPYLDA